MYIYIYIYKYTSIYICTYTHTHSHVNMYIHTCKYTHTDRPHMTDCTIDEKLSSIIIMSDASCATAVPAIPIDKPTSASLRAGASFVPSPVTATTSPIAFKHLTIVNLS